MTTEKVRTFKHGEGTGDVIYGLPVMLHFGGGDLYLNISLNSVASLLERQPYVNKVIRERMHDKLWKTYDVDYDLDKFRQQNYNKYTVSQCHLLAFGIDFEVLQEPWLFNIEPKPIAPIVVNDTGGHPQKSRFPGNTVDWGVLADYEKDCVFIGYDNEYTNFQDWRGLNIKRHKVSDPLEFAQVILGSKLYVSNQSLGMAMAEGMKVNRVLDVYRGPSRQYPLTDNGHTELTHELVKGYVYE